MQNLSRRNAFNCRPELAKENVIFQLLPIQIKSGFDFVVRQQCGKLPGSRR
jgi:hypothetical protein